MYYYRHRDWQAIQQDRAIYGYWIYPRLTITFWW